MKCGKIIAEEAVVSEKKRVKKRTVLIAVIMGLGILTVLGGLSFVPVLSLESKDMTELNGTYVTVCYEKEEAAARDVLALAEKECVRIAQKLDLAEPPRVCLYIYDQQSTFQTKKYGCLTLLFGLDWYVGDNRGTNVLLTSPAHPGTVHSYEDVKNTSLHELTHAYNYLINPDMSLWVNEGVALYLTNGYADRHFFKTGSAPSPAQMGSSNPLVFNGVGGYTFAYTYIQYLDQTYGWDKVLTLVQTGDFEGAFGKGEQVLYDEWIEFLRLTYS